MNTTPWIKTDDLQWRKQIDNKTFYLVEVRVFSDHYGVVSDVIDLDCYDQENIRDTITSYYSSLDEFNSYYDKEERNGIIAECIFEITNQSAKNGFTCETEDEAELLAEKYIEQLKLL